MAVKSVRASATNAPTPAEKAGTAVKKRYVALYKTPLDKFLIEALQRRVRDYETSVRNAEQNLAETVELLKDARAGLLRAQNLSSPDNDKRIEDEFGKLLLNPDIQKIEVRDNCLVVHTGPIFIRHRGKTYAMGRYKAFINALSSVVTFQSKDRCNRRPHPNVSEGGNPCFGNISHLVMKLMQERRFAPLIQICIEYLKNYTQDGDYLPITNITHWPVARGRSQRKEPEEGARDEP